MSANTEFTRLGTVPKEQLDALLGMDTTKVNKLLSKESDLLALAKMKKSLLELANNADALLALLKGKSNDNS